MLRTNALIAAMSAAGLLAACGGGGGGDTATTNTTSSAATVAVSGVASKGLMAGAIVEAVAVKDDGTLGDVLKSTTTGSDGSYSLTFEGTKDKPYVIRVRAKDDGSTTHLDEINGVQPLPAGFTMRALLVPAASGSVTTSASITPFSELAVAAAAKATGGITAANAAQASSTVEQLLGFDPTKVVPTTTSDANASLDQQKLAVMLTAVAKMADDGALGCSGTSGGAKTKCVVEALAAGAKADSIKLGDDSTNVSAALAGAVQAVVSTPSLAGVVNTSFVADVQQALACTTNCAAAPVTAPANATAAAAITAAKALFTQLRSDWATMFTRGGVMETTTSTANNEAFKFRAAMRSIGVPAEVAVQDLGVLLMGVDLYNDVKSGRSGLFTRSRAEGSVSGDFTNTLGAATCGLYADANNTTLATTPGAIVSIGCSANYRALPGAVFTRWRHGFSIAPQTDGTFTYQTRARRSTSAGENTALSPVFTGTLTPTLDAQPYGSVVGFAVTGSLAPAFVAGGTTLVNDHHEWTMSGTRTISGFKQELASLTGEIKSFVAGSDVPAGTLTVVSASAGSTPVAADGTKPTSTNPATQGTPSSLALDLKWTTAGAEFEGELSATDAVWDSSGAVLMPTQARLAGTLRNIESGVTREFISGSLTGTLTGFAAFNSAQPVSATNTYTLGISFTGAVSAPNRPKLELTLATSVKEHENFASQASLAYRVYAAGSSTPRSVIAITAERASEGASPTLTLSEATSKLSLRLLPEATTADLMYDGSLKVGQLSRSTSVVTFSDNTFVSLAFGL